MLAFRTILNSTCRYIRPAAMVVLMAVAVTIANAQTPPYAEFQYSTLTASGNTVTASWVPVVTSSGTSYVNMVIQFDVAGDGTLTIAPGYPQIVPSPIILVSNFMAGNYTGPAGDAEYYIAVAGPGVTVGGATAWSLATTAGASCATTPTTASWYVFTGPMTKNPLYARLKAAGITQQTYASYGGWGTTGAQSCNAGTAWGTNTLIGLSQAGGDFTISSFTASGVDKNLPVSTINYIKNQ